MTTQEKPDGTTTVSASGNVKEAKDSLIDPTQVGPGEPKLFRNHF